MRPSFANSFALQGRGRRECRVLAAPAVSCAIVRRKTHTSIQVQPRHSGIPCAVVLRLMPRSPRRRIPFASVIGELTASRTRSGSQCLRRLDASHGRQDHTVLPYASASFVCRAADRSRAKDLRQKTFPWGKPCLGQPDCIFRLGRPCSFFKIEC